MARYPPKGEFWARTSKEIDSGPSAFETIDDIVAEARKRRVAGNG